MYIELFRSLIMLHDCREELKEKKECFGATLGEVDNLSEVYIITYAQRN